MSSMPSRRPRSLRVALSVTLALAATVPLVERAAGAHAESGGTVCDWKDQGVVEPGVGLSTPVSATYSTGGETGVITCNGPILGRMPSGPGTIGFEARLGPTKPITCTSGGTGDYAGFFSFPTADGSRIHGIDYGTFSFAPLRHGAVFGGDYQGVLFSGTFNAAAVDGNCATPVTKVFFHTQDAHVAESPGVVTLPPSQ